LDQSCLKPRTGSILAARATGYNPAARHSRVKITDSGYNAKNADIVISHINPVKSANRVRIISKFVKNKIMTVEEIHHHVSRREGINTEFKPA
jgi:hypothetical protein